jgi:hypothetical protein
MGPFELPLKAVETSKSACYDSPIVAGALGYEHIVHTPINVPASTYCGAVWHVAAFEVASSNTCFLL